MMEGVKTERNLLTADDSSTNDAASMISSGNATGTPATPGGITSLVMVPFTPSTPGKESARQQNVRRSAPAKPTFEKDKYSFLCDLQMFHDKNGTPFTKLPKISGREVDLHKLYSVVISRGGWMKVNAREDWDEVIEELELPTRCVNNEIALKQIYIRFLDRYERVNFHGEDKDPAEDEDDEKRLHRRWSVRALHSMPSVYNHHQHNVPDALRSSLKLSDDLYRASEYDKLILSLLSPLPNEQDFAINVCTLMSNENKHTLHIDRCPRLVYALLAHAGVFNHFTLRDTFNEYYSNIRKNSLQRFWKECLFEKPQVLELSLEDCFAKMGTDPSALIASIYQDEEELEREKAENADEALDIADDKNDGRSRLSMATLRTFLSLGTGLGTNDYIGQRVLQIAAIFRNLSFNDENLSLLGRNRTFVRFLIMCANARWNNLHHMGLDMLGNIAHDIDLNDPQSDEVTRCLLSTLSEGLEGADRGVIISCLEVLSKIAQKESNEDTLNRCLNQELYNQITLFLCLNDIMLLLYTLECIYSLTSMGEKPCHAIMHIRGVLETLVSLVTVEAQSYGPDACILMRVVETIPGNVATGQQAPYHGTAVPGTATTMAQLTVHKDAAQGTATGTAYPPQETPKHHMLNNNSPLVGTGNKPMPALSIPSVQQQQPPPQPTNNQPAMVATTSRPPGAASPQSGTVLVQRTDTNTPTIVQSPGQPTIMGNTSSLAAKHFQQQQVLESEQFACAWLKATFELHSAPAIRTDQQEVYKLYMATNGKLGRKVIVPAPHFPRCVRSVFGVTVGPVQFKIEQNGIESISSFYEGLKMRAKPLPIVHKGTVLTPNIEYVTAPSSNSSSTPAQCKPAVVVAAADPQPGLVMNNITMVTTSGTTTVTIAPLAMNPQQVTITSKPFSNAGTTTITTSAGSSLATLSTAITFEPTASGGRSSFGSPVVFSTAKGQPSLPMPSLTFTTPSSFAAIRTSSVIASTQAAIAPVSQSTVSVVSKAAPMVSGAAKATQLPKHLVPFSTGQATVTVTPGTGSKQQQQQLLVTQLGGKSVLLNQTAASSGGVRELKSPPFTFA